MTDRRAVAEPCAGDPLVQLRAVATRLIEQHFATSPTRRTRLCLVLSTLLTSLSALDPSRRARLPIALRQREVRAVCTRLSRRNPFSLHARRRVGALAWLLPALEAEGVLRVPPLRLPLQRPRDSAVPLTAQAFGDASFLARHLTAGLKGLLEERLRDQESAAPDLAVLTALIWEGPVLLPQAPWLLQRLRLGDYDWNLGLLRLRLPSRSAQQPTGSEAVVRVFLRPLARVIFNAYLLDQAGCGALELGNPEAPLFPTLTPAATPAQRRAFHAALARCVAALVRRAELALSPRRLLAAARLHALETFPPLLVGVLSRELLYAPTPDSDVCQLTAPESPVTRAQAPFSSGRPGPAGRAARLLEEGEAQGPLPALTSSLEVSYREAGEGLRAIERLLEQPETRFPRARVLAAARTVHARLEADLPGGAAPLPPVLANLRLILRWLVWQLAHRTGTAVLRVRNARASVRIRIQSLAPLCETFLAATEVRDLDEEEWIEWTLEAVALQRTPRSKRLMRARLKAFHAYLRAYESTPERPVAAVAWARRELAVPAAPAAYPLLLPWELDRVRHALARGRNQALTAVLDGLIVLGGYAGLRLREACGLRLGDVHLGVESLIQIGPAKTRSGRRLVPLHLLFPEAELERFRHFYTLRLHEAAGDLSAPLLATASSPQGVDPKQLARRVARAIRHETGKPLTCHSLRHGFASFFPLRWFVAFEGRPAAASLGALLQTPLFSAEALARFRLLFVPAAWAGGPVTTHPFEILALLMGHAGPEVTVTVHVQTLDWLQRLYVDREVVQGREPRLPLSQAARAVHKSLPTLYTWFPDGKRSQGVPCSQVLERQRGVLNAAAAQGRRPGRSRRMT